MDFSIAIDLNRFIYSKETVEDIGGRTEEGIFIPYRYNPIYKEFPKERRVRFSALVTKKEPCTPAMTHFLVAWQREETKTYLRTLGKRMPVMGEMYQMDPYKMLDDTVDNKNPLSILNSTINYGLSYPNEFGILKRMVEAYDFEEDPSYRKGEEEAMRQKMRDFIKLVQYDKL